MPDFVMYIFSIILITLKVISVAEVFKKPALGLLNFLYCLFSITDFSVLTFIISLLFALDLFSIIFLSC